MVLIINLDTAWKFMAMIINLDTTSSTFKMF